MDGTLCVAGISRVVGDHADGGAALMDVAEKVHYGVAIFGIAISGRLIGKENHGIADESAGDGNALLLTGGELRGGVVSTMGHLDPFERTLDIFLACVRCEAA